MADAAALGENAPGEMGWEEDVQRMSRERRLASYRELIDGLDDILAATDADGEEAEQMAALVEEVEVQLRTLAQLLNDEETVEVTPGLLKRVVKAPETGEVQTMILFPPPPQPGSAPAALQAAPYEVLFDERDWYPCVITGVVPPAKDVDRVQYRAWILGHNVEEVVHSEALRPWQAGEAAGELMGGVACHVIHPQTGRYVEGVVDRLTLEETVLVKVPADAAAPGAASSPTGGTVTVTVPLSHVRVGKFYAQLRHRPKTDEERVARRAEQARLKRERTAEQRQQVAAKVAKDADDWQALMGDMMGVDAGARKHKKRRV